MCYNLSLNDNPFLPECAIIGLSKANSLIVALTVLCVILYFSLIICLVVSVANSSKIGSFKSSIVCLLLSRATHQSLRTKYVV